jgi:hypothetical protein
VEIANATDIFPVEAKITLLEREHLSRVHRTVRDKHILKFQRVNMLVRDLRDFLTLVS